MNVALPSIRRDLGFSAQDLQWVLSGHLVAARLAQGAGAALMAPAGLSILTTTFSSGDDRNKALGIWGFHRALLACAFFLLAAAVIALRATNSRGEPAARPAVVHAVRNPGPRAEPAD
jgi:MFS family permease